MSNSISDYFTNGANWKKIAAPVALAAGLTAGLTGCGQDDDATVASHNVSKAADNFEINRQIVFYNGITDKYIAEIEGKCSILADGADKQLEVTCKIGEEENGESKIYKHFLGLSDNVSYFVLQTEGADVSLYHHRVTFKPQSIIPDIDYRGSAQDLPRQQP